MCIANFMHEMSRIIYSSCIYESYVLKIAIGTYANSLKMHAIATYVCYSNSIGI